MMFSTKEKVYCGKDKEDGGVEGKCWMITLEKNLQWTPEMGSADTAKINIEENIPFLFYFK